MNKDLTLLIMAAGMGSRFGGLKQIEPMGPNGEFLIDYSIYDAINAGFNKVVFIVGCSISPDIVYGSSFVPDPPESWIFDFRLIDGRTP